MCKHNCAIIYIEIFDFKLSGKRVNLFDPAPNKRNTGNGRNGGAFVRSKRLRCKIG
ncbi:MAG: hypothetical protein AW06_003034 [Candidatus Accumulibacter cognatus]|uniref:Uncharacterized protein n=1 Tax=Candidatus Accumulibacter cognatus TaxID=2954383 RepID=A0A080M3H3_9PROT|nr:MAG: hypothetical protein AW06_003034 [Candidatus Accumulibacter cognatus]